MTLPPAGVVIRPERSHDREAVRRVNVSAFERHDEADLVDALRARDDFVPALSLVAVVDGAVVGYSLLSPAVVQDDGHVHPVLALGPVAVSPEHQRGGVGAALIQHGLDDARELGHRLVIVLGHPDYYPRFGFRPAPPLGIHPPFEVSPEAFMVMELVPGALEEIRGEVRYPPEFEAV